MLPIPSRLWRSLTAGWCLLLGLWPGHSRAASITLSDNLAAPTAYTEAVQGQTWVGAPFRTEEAVTLDTVSLLLANSLAGTAVLTLYTGTAQPETLVGSLTALESSPTDGLFLATFYANGLSLDAASSYWVVLRVVSGRFEWAFTDSSAGTGPGFTPGWAVTDNGGASWFTQQSEPMQMRVEAVSAQADVPEPGSLALTALGAGVVGLILRKRRRAKGARAACQPLALLAVALPLCLPAAAAPGPVTITSPAHGESVRTAMVTVSARLDPAVNAASLRATLNGKDVSASFVRTGHCRPDGCPYTATFYPGGALRGGKNLLRVRARTAAQGGSWQTSFDWRPGGLLGGADSGYLPPAVGFTTVTPGGGAPWVQVYSNQGAGKATVYPQGAACTTVYQVLALDRKDLTFKSYMCYDNNAALTDALRAFTASHLVVAGTTYGRNALPQLNTTPIGGTNYADAAGSDFPYGYMVVGVGGAPAGQACESSTNAEFQLNADKWARANGLLALDANGNYNFHSSDYVEFKVRPTNYRTQAGASITVGPTTYTTPRVDYAWGGFWLLILERRSLNSRPDCTASAADPNLYPNCGTYYQTTNDDESVSQRVWANLAAALKGAGKDKLIFLVAISQPHNTDNFPSAELADAVNNLGGSGYTLQRFDSNTVPSGEELAWTLVSSNDDGFKQAFTGSAVLSTNVGEVTHGGNNGQTGYVKGLLARDHHGLYRPLAASQETAATIDSRQAADFSAQPLFWSQPVAWPLMDTPGRVAAYKYLSYQVVTKDLVNATGSHLNDVRFYYTGSQNTTIAHGVDPTSIPYPASLPWTDPTDQAKYSFTASEMAEVARQLKTELGLLNQSLAFLGSALNGTGLGNLMLNSDTGISAKMFSALATVKSSLAASEQATVAFDPSKMLKTEAPFIALGNAINPAFGAIAGIFNAASTVTAQPGLSESNIASDFADYETTVSDLANNTSEYIEGLQIGFDMALDNVYSDWGKLSAAGRKAADTDGWYAQVQTQLEPLKQAANTAALKSFYLQLVPKSYAVDYWPAQPVSNPADIGSWFVTSGSTNGIPWTNSTCTKMYGSDAFPLPAWSWNGYKTPGNRLKSDLFVVGGTIANDKSIFMSEQYPSADLLSTLFDPQGPLKLPRDLFFAPNGPLSRRNGPTYNSDGQTCYQ